MAACCKQGILNQCVLLSYRPHEDPVVSISQALSESQAQIPQAQQLLQPMVFTTSASVVDPEQATTAQAAQENNPQLFHSTKF